MWLVFSALFPLLFDQGFSGVRFALTDVHSLQGILWPGGRLGTMVGAVFWVIDRPDLNDPARSLAASSKK